MIAVLAHRNDAATEETARLLGARLVTCLDLCRPGWAVLPEFDEHPLGALDAVLVRMENVWPEELTELRVGDREYAAAEMTAFLLAWLTGLRCPVLNAPAANSLLGPGLRAEQWVRLAASLGVPVVPVRRGAANERPIATSEVVVVGDQAFSRGANQSDQASAIALAISAGARLLSVRFAGGRFAGASGLADLTLPGVREALLQELCGGGKVRRSS